MLLINALCKINIENNERINTQNLCTENEFLEFLCSKVTTIDFNCI